MTDAQKDILIAKMLDPSATLTDEEIEVIAADEELRDILDASARVAGSLAPAPTFDIEKEWKQFSRLLRPKPSSYRWILRVAAIFAGVAIAGGLLVRIIDTAMYTGDPTDIPGLYSYTELPAARTDTSTDTTSSTSATHSPSPTPHRPSTPTRPSTAADAEQAEIEEILSIEQARVDNDVALHNAEVFRQQYIAMLDCYDTRPDQNLEVYLESLTME